jgi:hypothetical protein
MLQNGENCATFSEKKFFPPPADILTPYLPKIHLPISSHRNPSANPGWKRRTVTNYEQGNPRREIFVERMIRDQRVTTLWKADFEKNATCKE